MNLIRRFYRTALNLVTPNVEAQGETMAGELHDGVEVLETYGFTAPPPDTVAEGLCVFVNGHHDHGVILGWFDKTHRPTTVAAGEVCVYSHTGSKITLKNNGDIEITPSGGLTIINSNLQVNGDTVQNGKIESTGDIKAGAISLQNHKHGGISTGSSLTAVPQ